MNYEKMTKAELINEIKSLKSGMASSKHKEIGTVLLDPEEKYLKLVESAFDAIFIANARTGIILFANRRAEDLIGIPVEETVGMHHTQVYPPEDVERNKKLFKKYAQAGKGITTEDIFVQHNDGRKIPVEISSSVFELGGINVMQGIFRDITERKQIEKDLQESKIRYKLITNLTSDYIYHISVSLDRKILVDWITEEFTHITGYTLNDVKTSDMWKKVVHPDDLSTLMEKIQNIIPGKSEEYECRIITKKSETIWLHVYGRPEWDTKKRKVTGIIGAVSNITKRKETEESLKRTNSQLSLMFESLPIVPFICKAEGNFGATYVGIEVEKITGYKPEVFTSNDTFWATRIHPEDAPRVLADISKNLERRYYEHEYRWQVADGSYRWFYDVLRLVKLPDKNDSQIVGIWWDITERKQMEEELKVLNKSLEERVLERTEELLKVNKEIKENEAMLQGIFSSLYEAAIVVYDRDGKITALWGTPEMDKRYGIRAADAVGKAIEDILPLEQANMKLTQIRHIYDTGEKLLVEEVSTLPGGDFWHETSLSPILDTKGNITAVVGFIRDVTKHKQSERKTKDLARFPSENPNPVLRIARNGKIIYSNNAGSILLSFWDTQIGGILPGHWHKFISKVLYSNLSEVAEIELGNLVFSSTFAPVSESDYVNIYAQDITERKQIENEILKKNSYLRILQVAAVAANEAEDIKGAFLPVLAQICNYTGWEIGHAYALSENDPELLKPIEVWCLEEQKQFMDFCSVTKKTDFARGVGLPGRVLASGKPNWIIDVTKDSNFLRTQIALDLNIKSGIAFPVMVGHSVVAVLEFFTTQEVGPDQQFMAIMADVGTQLGRVVERMQSKHVLEKNYLSQKVLNDILKASHEEKTLMELMEHSIDLILNIPWLKAKMGGIFLVENEPEVLVLKVQRNLPKELIKTCKRVPFGMCLCGEAALSGKILHSDNIDDNHVILYKGIEPHGHYNIPILLDGKVIGLILLYLNAGHCRDDKEVMFLETLANTLSGIIKRKKMEEALVQSEKMKAMGIMTAGVAHEFNNILAVISSNAQLLEETKICDKEMMKSFRTICRMTDDGAEIVNRMYEFTNVHKDTSDYISVDLHDLIMQVIGFIMPRWKEMAQAAGINYQIVWEGAKTLPFVLGNPSELREVVLNIINNALDAMPGGGMITVKTRCVQSSEPAIPDKPIGQEVRRKEKIVSMLRVENSELKSDFVEITFTDTGKGMTEDVKKAMFVPFFTTRSPQGTGLGMSVSYGIISRHGGKIDVESELGKGSVISLVLPVTDKPTRHVVTSGQDGKLNIDGLNILVVDDKKEICESLSKIFIEEGHKVRSTNSGAKAIKLLEKNDYDLLLCDLVMPDVNGKDIMNAFKAMERRPKVGLITGWKYKMEDAKKDGLDVDFIVKKPFNLYKLRKDINGLWT